MPSWVDEPAVERASVSGVIISIDHFGNLISNIDAALIERFRLPLVHAGNHAFPLLRTYGDTRPGQYLALVNSFGVVEIARAEQSAAEGPGSLVREVVRQSLARDSDRVIRASYPSGYCSGAGIRYSSLPCYVHPMHYSLI